MKPVKTISGVAAPLPLINVDTDKIFPARYLKTVKRTGLSKVLFEALRYRADGTAEPKFVLNLPGYDKAVILIAGENFGCGSSREHAPWALQDFGFQSIIAPSFADIFYGNSLKSGLLPIRLPSHQVETLSQIAASGPDRAFNIDLEQQIVSGPGNLEFRFDIDQRSKQNLLEGISEIDVAERKLPEIVMFEKTHLLRNPWLSR